MARGAAIWSENGLIWAAFATLCCNPAPQRAPVPAPSAPASAALIQVVPSAMPVRPSAPIPSAAPPASGGSTSKASASELVVLVGGDVNLGRGVGKRLRADIEYDPFRGVAKWLSAADIVLVNLESPLFDPPDARHVGGYVSPPVGAGILARSGVNVVSVANQRVWPGDKSGFLQTLDSLKSAGVAFAGGSAEPDRQYAPCVLHVKGFNVAVFGVTDVWDREPRGKDEARYVAIVDWARLEPEIRRARAENDVVLVSYHGGREYSAEPNADTIAFVRRVAKLGVDAVAGHHPHVPEGIAWFDGKPAFYSLGNLVFGVMRDYPGTAWGFLGKLVFTRGGAVTASACPYHIDASALPEAASNGEAEARALELLVASSHTGKTKVGPPDADGCLPLAPAR